MTSQEVTTSHSQELCPCEGGIWSETSAASTIFLLERCHHPYYEKGQRRPDILIGKIESNSLESWLSVPSSSHYIMHSWFFKYNKKAESNHYDNVQVS